MDCLPLYKGDCFYAFVVCYLNQDVLKEALLQRNVRKANTSLQRGANSFPFGDDNFSEGGKTFFSELALP